MPLRASLIAILILIAIPVAIALYDSHYTTVTHTCGGRQTFTLSPNLPGNVHAAEIRLETAVHSGRVAISDFANVPEGTPQSYAAGASAFATYDGEMYGPVEVTFDPAPGAQCDLRLIYRLASDISMFNPLW